MEEIDFKGAAMALFERVASIPEMDEAVLDIQATLEAIYDSGKDAGYDTGYETGYDSGYDECANEHDVYS